MGRGGKWQIDQMHKINSAFIGRNRRDEIKDIGGSQKSDTKR